MYVMKNSPTPSPMLSVLNKVVLYVHRCNRNRNISLKWSFRLQRVKTVKDRHLSSKIKHFELREENNYNIIIKYKSQRPVCR